MKPHQPRPVTGGIGRELQLVTLLHLEPDCRKHIAASQHSGTPKDDTTRVSGKYVEQQAKLLVQITAAEHLAECF